MIKIITPLLTALIILLLTSGCSQLRRQPVQVQSYPSQQHSKNGRIQQQAPRQSQRSFTRNRPTPRQSTSQRQVTSPPQTQSRPTVQTRPSSHNNYSPALDTSSYSHARNRIIGIAKNTLGTRYKYGGNDPRKGFDCSGLMSYVHRQGLGLKIPRTAAAQRDKSRTISYAQLQPGDMLFFKTGKRTNHVGVYIGNRQFIHASTGKSRVMVAKMDSKYWHSRFVKFGTFF